MWIEILVSILTLLASFLLLIWHRQQYWQRLGVSVPPGKFPFGNNPFFTSKGRNVHGGIICKEQYEWAKNDPNAKKMGLYGLYIFGNKTIVVTNPDLVR